MASKAAAEARLVLSNISTTMMPFLYQTRSLSILPLTVSPLRFHATRFNAVARQISTSSRQSFPQPNQSTYQARDNRSRSSRSPTRGQRQPQNRNVRDIDEIPFDLNKDENPRRRSKAGSKSTRYETIKLDEFGEPDDGIFGGSDFMEDDSIDLQGQDQIVGSGSMNLRGPRESTITDSERRTFQNIFAEIFSKHQSPMTSNSTTLSPRDTAKVKLDSILTDALSVRARNQAEKESLVNRWPGPLRPAVAKAIGLTNDAETEGNESAEDKQAQADMDIDELESLREPERQRVEKLMRDAATDIELWDVMEKEVFSLIPKLGLEEAPSVNEIKETNKRPSKIKKQKSKAPSLVDEPTEKGHQAKREESGNGGTMDKDHVSKDQTDPKLNSVVTDPTTGSEIPALAFYGPMYPSYLLLGIRLLDRAFDKPSPLALSILPKIKSLGAISHVLGASPSLYNEILRVYLYRYEDFQSIVATLNDMDASAVDLNEETLDIVIEILILRRRVKQGEKGPVLQRLWSRMPQFATASLNMWREKIALGIAARRQYDQETLAEER
jgi:hypothetical protein